MATTTYYYFVDDRNRIVYYGEEFSSNPDHIYVGTSDNPNPRMAVAAFMQNGAVTSGYRLRKL
jgi:hypothetical protein